MTPDRALKIGLIGKSICSQRIVERDCLENSCQEKKLRGSRSGIFQNFLVVLSVQTVFLNFVIERLAGDT